MRVGKLLQGCCCNHRRHIHMTIIPLSNCAMNEAEELLKWLDARPADEVTEYRFIRYDETTYLLCADDCQFFGKSFLDCLRQAKVFLKPH